MLLSLWDLEVRVLAEVPYEARWLRRPARCSQACPVQPVCVQLRAGRSTALRTQQGLQSPEPGLRVISFTCNFDIHSVKLSP